MVDYILWAKYKQLKEWMHIKMKKPGKTHLSITCSDRMKDEIKQKAEQEGLKMADFIRDSINYYMRFLDIERVEKRKLELESEIMEVWKNEH